MHPRLVKYDTVALVWMYCCLRLDLLRSLTTADCDDITADVIIADSRFPFTSTYGFCSSQLVPDFYCSSSSSNLSPALANITAAGLNWPLADYEQLTQLWMSPLLIQLPSKR
ncbi:hypothetical protein F511_19163 [Dorcoceras hygrometricum]|uniref:Uncharacterized protein n=1 Tax=Dorcoceras hygrometricum TaxID=472368 RepID=A0A2Z7C1B7_9LAMI|nr:hypothetical protein F511_19163 [Dorcoceras hygrometricum]